MERCRPRDFDHSGSASTFSDSLCLLCTAVCAAPDASALSRLCRNAIYVLALASGPYVQLVWLRLCSVRSSLSSSFCFLIFSLESLTCTPVDNHVLQKLTPPPTVMRCNPRNFYHSPVMPRLGRRRGAIM